MCENIINPGKLKQDIFASKKEIEKVKKWRKEIENIIFKKDKRLLVIVGPCSIHDMEQAIDYAKQLKAISQKYKNIFVVMRSYFEKPRTSIGWKGLIQDPDLNCTNNIEKGLVLARKLLLELVKLDIPTASELLEPLQVLYYEDLLSYGAIGARTSESQIHREMVSGLEFPIGFKNGTDGSFDIAINAILSSKNSHSFLSVNESGNICKTITNGNKLGHIILRGGKHGPNYDINTILKLEDLLKEKSIKTGIIVDASHGNSNKKAENQIKVVNELANYIDKISAVMIESNINFGSCNFNPCKDDKNNLKYGVSITDECIDLKQTEKIFEILDKAKNI